MRCAPRATTTTSNDRHVRVCYLSRSARARMYLSNLTAWDGSSSGCCCALRARGVAHAMPHGQRLPPEATTAQSTVNVVRDLKVCALLESERCTSRPASPRTFGETALCVRRVCSVCSACSACAPATYLRAAAFGLHQPSAAPPAITFADRAVPSLATAVAHDVLPMLPLQTEQDLIRDRPDSGLSCVSPSTRTSTNAQL